MRKLPFRLLRTALRLRISLTEICDRHPAVKFAAGCFVCSIKSGLRAQDEESPEADNCSGALRMMRLFCLIFPFGGNAAPNVAFGFVAIQYLPYLVV